MLYKKKLLMVNAVMRRFKDPMKMLSLYQRMLVSENWYSCIFCMVFLCIGFSMEHWQKTPKKYSCFKLLDWTEACSKPSRSSKIELFAKTVNSFKLLVIVAKSSILDVWQDFECIIGHTYLEFNKLQLCLVKFLIFNGYFF